MSMFDLIDDDAQFTAHSLMESHAEEFRDPVGRRRDSLISQLRSKILWIGKLRLKMKLRQYSIWPMA